MSYGKMNEQISIISTEPIKDAEGFVNKGETLIAFVRAYVEQKNATEKWRNMAQGAEVDALFRLRVIPGVTLTTRHLIVFQAQRYNIYGVENIKNKGLYLEVLGVRVNG